MKRGPGFPHSHTSASSSTVIHLQAEAGWPRGHLASAESANPGISEQCALSPCITYSLPANEEPRQGSKGRPRWYPQSGVGVEPEWPGVELRLSCAMYMLRALFL